MFRDGLARLMDYKALNLHNICLIPAAFGYSLRLTIEEGEMSVEDTRSTDHLMAVTDMIRHNNQSTTPHHLLHDWQQKGAIGE